MTTLAADMLTADAFGTCLPDAALESYWLTGGKGIRAPRTCLPDDAAWSQETLALATGFWPDGQSAEWIAYSAWQHRNREGDPLAPLLAGGGGGGVVVATPEPTPVAPIPVMAGGVLLASALAFAVALKWGTR